MKINKTKGLKQILPINSETEDTNVVEEIFEEQ